MKKKESEKTNHKMSTFGKKCFLKNKTTENRKSETVFSIDEISSWKIIIYFYFLKNRPKKLEKSWKPNGYFCEISENSSVWINSGEGWILKYFLSAPFVIETLTFKDMSSPHESIRKLFLSKPPFLEITHYMYSDHIWRELPPLPLTHSLITLSIRHS